MESLNFSYFQGHHDISKGKNKEINWQRTCAATKCEYHQLGHLLDILNFCQMGRVTRKFALRGSVREIQADVKAARLIFFPNFHEI